MSISLKTGRSIQEFWIDFLLEEEFSCDRVFAATFASACGLALDDTQAISVAHSVCDEFGEADLVVAFRLREGGERAALLLENKITASFQPEQAERYRLRGDRGVADGLWELYRTVLVAPDRYIQTNHGFDYAVSLQTLSEWVCQSDPVRRLFKTARLQRAIDKKNTTGIQLVDPTMTAFREWYRERMLAFGSGFVPPVSRPAYWDDNWMEWTSERLPSDWRFRHRTRTGALDLSHPQFSMDAFEKIALQLPVGSTYRAVGKSRGAIAMDVPPITDFANFPAAAPIVDNALRTACQWQDVLTAHHPVTSR